MSRVPDIAAQRCEWLGRGTTVAEVAGTTGYGRGARAARVAGQRDDTMSLDYFVNVVVTGPPSLASASKPSTAPDLDVCDIRAY